MGITDICMLDYLIEILNEKIAMCEEDILAENEALYAEYVVERGLDIFEDILAAWYYNVDVFDYGDIVHDQGSGYENGDEGDNSDENFGEFHSPTCNYGELRCKMFKNGYNEAEPYGVGFMKGFDTGYMYGGCDYVEYQDVIGNVGDRFHCEKDKVRCLGFNDGFNEFDNEGLGFMFGFDHGYQYGDCADGDPDNNDALLDAILVKDEFVTYLWRKVKEDHCPEFAQAMITTLLDNEWLWKDMLEFTFDPAEHTKYSANAGKDAWDTCFPEWTGKDVTNDNKVDAEDVKALTLALVVELAH